MRVAFAVLLFLVSPAAAQPPSAETDEAAIREVIATWYGQLQKRGAGPATLGKQGYWLLYAPGAIHGDARNANKF